MFLNCLKKKKTIKDKQEMDDVLNDIFTIMRGENNVFNEEGFRASRNDKKRLY